MIALLNRYGNGLIAGFSFLKSTLTGNPVVYGMPTAVGVELTNHCNLKCPECYSGSGTMTRNRGFMDPGLFEKIVSELEPFLLNINLYFQGEPMLHPMFFRFVERCRRINTVVSTNGHFLTAEWAERVITSGLKKLIVSLDGMDQQTYSAYRINGNFDKVTEGIKNIAEARKRYYSPLKLELQFLVSRMNEHQIPVIEQFAREAGADLKLKSMQIINPDKIDKWLPSERIYSRYERKEGSYKNRNRLPDRCARLWFNPVITWDGMVIPCCFDKNADHIMGDLKEETFREVWKGTRYGLFRRTLVTGRSSIDICTNCTSGIIGVRC